MESTLSLTPPLQSGRYLVEIGSEVVAFFQDCSGLSLEVEVQEVIEGGNNEFIRKLPGRIKYSNITLKRGISDNKQFIAWRPRIEGGKIIVERKTVLIMLFSHAGQTVKTWEVKEAYPIKWTGPDLRATSMEVAIETLELAHQGWKEQ